MPWSKYAPDPEWIGGAEWPRGCWCKPHGSVIGSSTQREQLPVPHPIGATDCALRCNYARVRYGSGVAPDDYSADAYSLPGAVAAAPRAELLPARRGVLWSYKCPDGWSLSSPEVTLSGRDEGRRRTYRERRRTTFQCAPFSITFDRHVNAGLLAGVFRGSPGQPSVLPTVTVLPEVLGVTTVNSSSSRASCSVTPRPRDCTAWYRPAQEQDLLRFVPQSRPDQSSYSVAHGNSAR